MTADDLSAPLGQGKKPRRAIRIPVPQIVAGALSLFFGVFVLWALFADNPFGGEPIAVVAVHMQVAGNAPGSPDAPPSTPAAAASHPAMPPAPATATATAPAPSTPTAPTRTITIIDGKTGTKQEVVIPDPAAANAAAETPPVDQKFVEMTPQGPVPKIAADGTRPAEAFAQPVQPLPGKPDAPRVALIVGGLGVSDRATADAIAKLPGAVSFGFVPYGGNVAALVARARSGGHEVLLQVPMEPFDYPDNDPGPQTLLTTLTPQQNLDRLYAVMAKFQGYVGIATTMGARFTASEDALAPVLRETARRGLIFVDNGASPRSVAARIAGANNLPFARADVIIDAVPSAAEIDHALDRLEMAAREHGLAVGIASALPVAVDHLAKWAKAAAGRGLLLVPISAAAVKAKQS